MPAIEKTYPIFKNCKECHVKASDGGIRNGWSGRIMGKNPENVCGFSERYAVHWRKEEHTGRGRV
ncbi:MAG: hypothetical protein NC420_15885, partial [Eubacterium sp.]|nr:hypothetical protein [Eubacterium sp.]